MGRSARERRRRGAGRTARAHAGAQSEFAAGSFPTAIYAARELKKYLAGAKGDVANKDAAQVFYRVLVTLIEELR
jgi:hypothetical protein